MNLSQLREPIVQAPLAGGVSTPRLAAAVGEAGGLGCLAAGYTSIDALADDIHELRSLSPRPFAVNIFSPPQPAGDREAIGRYADSLRADAERAGVALGEPRHDDDQYEAKVELAITERIAIVSFTFGCPSRATVAALHGAGCDVWVTVTNPDEAALARDAGADALAVQGFEAGGHRGYFNDSTEPLELGLLVALRLIARRVDLPLIAAGGITDGAAIAAVLCAGAVAAQLGSALMLTLEAGTNESHRQALRSERATTLTRAFSGRNARGIVNRFLTQHNAGAPIADPDVHYLTVPIRAAARAAGDPEAVNLWAGQAHELAIEAPAAEVIRRLGEDARAALRDATRWLSVE